MVGIYVHIPYCVKKCGYCDFYSVCDLSSADAYTDAVCRKMSEISDAADTLYIGGGTPSLLGADRLARIIASAKPVLTADAEITVEVNPGDDMTDLLPKLSKAGVNRLSIGMQSHVDSELKLLTRRHSAEDVDKTISVAREAGISNISLDVMLGIEGQTTSSLKETLDYCITSDVRHISTYMLKIEKGTPFERASFNPSDDLQADMYLFTVDYLAQHGFIQYEISNFCKPDKHSRHNLKYWRCEPYIGIGAAAHSFYNGKRSYYTRSVKDFINGVCPVDDGAGGNFEEAVMLGLRLSEGIDCNKLRVDYPDNIGKVNSLILKASELQNTGLLNLRENRIALTPRGFLVSNSIINLLLD